MEVNISLGYKLKREYSKRFIQFLNMGITDADAKAMAEKQTWDEFKDALEWKNKALELAKNSEKCTENWYSINISYPRETIRKPLSTIEQRNFIQKCHEFSKRKCWIQGEYCFEQKGENKEECGWGIHAHFTVISKYAKAETLRETLSTFKGMVQCSGIKVIKIPSKTDLERRNQYLRGIKVGEEKQKAIEWDTIWRDQIGIENIYQVQ